MNLESFAKPRRLRALLMAVCICAASGLPSSAEEPPASAEEPKPMPDLIWDERREKSTFPLFVSAGRLGSGSSKLNEELLSPGTRFMLESELRNLDFSQCQPGSFIVPHSGPPPFWRNYQAVISDSDFVVLARVTGVQKGIWVSNPGTLFRLEPERWLKSEDDWDEKYFFIASVEMELGGRQVCYRNPIPPELPELGWHVLIPYDDTRANREMPLLYTDQAKIVVIPPSGPVHLSETATDRQSEWKGADSARILNEVEKMIREGKEQ